MTTVFVSEALGEERLPFRAALPADVPERVRWMALAAKYRDGLAALNFKVTPVARPEIYQADVAHAVLGVRPGDWHLAVKPLAHLRPFHGLPNVFVFDGFCTEPSGPGGVWSFSNALRLFRTADAVAFPNAAAARCLGAADFPNGVYLPPPFPARRTTHLSPLRRMTDAPRFLAAFMDVPPPGDLALLVEGFTMARAQRGDLHLTVALPSGRQGGAAIPPQTSLLLAEGITFTCGAGTCDSGASDLFVTSDFFLSATPPGAPSLLLVEAMLAGLPVLAPMADEGDLPGLGHAVPIATVAADACADEEPLMRYARLALRRPTAKALRDAVLTASALDAPSRARIAAAGRRAAEESYGLAAFEAGLRGIAHRLAGGAP